MTEPTPCRCSSDDGGPAFPVPDVFDERRGETIQYGSAGMSLRDHFAGMALQGMLANQHQFKASDEHMFARDAYKLADAMLRARATTRETL